MPTPAGDRVRSAWSDAERRRVDDAAAADAGSRGRRGRRSETGGEAAMVASTGLRSERRRIRHRTRQRLALPLSLLQERRR